MENGPINRDINIHPLGVKSATNNSETIQNKPV